MAKPAKTDINSIPLLNAETATGPGPVFSPDVGNVGWTFQAVANGSSGAFTANIDIEVSNDGVEFIVMGSISLSGTATTADTDGFATNAAWSFLRANVTAISGTGANVTVTLGV